ncbi:hypothetical protein GYB61_08275 [bacterium]|nr:hypothetical protein [bacterium]
MTADRSQQRLVRALYRIGRALARIVIRHGLSAKDVQNIFKKAFVDVAREDYGINGRPTNKARVATLTGLTRVEVARLVDAPRPHDDPDAGSQHPLNRIVMRWVRDPAWHDTSGAPAVLPITGESPSFESLVADSGGDIAWQTLLKELERLAIVERQDERVTLKQHGFMPAKAEAEVIPMLGEDVASLLDTFDLNLQSQPDKRRYQRRVIFRGVDAEGIRLIQQFATSKGQRLLEELDAELAPHAGKGESRPNSISGLGIYVFDLDDEPDEVNE